MNKRFWRSGIKITVTLLFFIYKSTDAQMPGFSLTGDPTSLNGASWSYQDSVDGIFYDMAGILMAPDTTLGPLPAVILSHGQNGRASAGYPPGMGKKFVEWGYVVIAANLCHASNVAVGSPGTNANMHFGASEANVLRNMKCWDILASLNYVDTNCIGASGNSMGSFTSLATVAAHTEKFSCANHTGGGISLTGAFAAPTDSHAMMIQTPYIFHHSDSDLTYHISMDSAFNHILDSTGCPHEFHVYHNYTHGMVTMDSATLARTKAWFDIHKCMPLVTSFSEKENPGVILYPNPANEYIYIHFTERPDELRIFDLTGKCIATVIKPTFDQRINLGEFGDGIYIYTANTGSKTVRGKLMVAGRH